MSLIEADSEAIVIGGGTWLPIGVDGRVRLYPVRSNIGESVLFRFIECFGILMPDGPIDSTLRSDVRRIHKWLAQNIGDQRLTTPGSAVGAPCWCPPGAPLPLTTFLQSANRVLDRELLNSHTEHLRFFEDD